MRIDRDVNRIILGQVPCGTGHVELPGHECLEVGILGAEIAGVAQSAVVLHVNDKRANLAIA